MTVNQSSAQLPSLQIVHLASGQWLLRGELYLKDRIGELAELASGIARQGANIEHFCYNRSQNANRVKIAAGVGAGQVAGRVADEFQTRGWLAPPDASAESMDITDARGLLRLKVSLEDRPGTLAAFATVLKEHRANVIYMHYDGAKAPGLAEIVVATQCPEEISRLLQDLDGRDEHYYVEWQGDQPGRIEDIIGLSVVERFLLSLKAVLPQAKCDELRELIRSSSELHQTLVSFKREAGGTEESMAASQVFTSVLQPATSSLSKTGAGFSLRVSGPVQLTPHVSLLMLACPTGANSYLLRSRDGLVLIDTSYGLYYADAMRAMSAHGIDRAKLRTALFTHPDADHAGWAAPLERDCGVEIYMHPDSDDVFAHENRAYGSSTRLMALNGYYTKLINRLTDLQKPRRIRPFPAASGTVGAFEVTGRFEVADLELLVLQSHGGHVPGQVFFYCPRPKALFCGDYLIDLASLSDRTKSALSIPKYLMTSTNSDGRLFAREMQCLAKLMFDGGHGDGGMIFPGHGEFYRVQDAEGMLRDILGC